MAKVEEEEEKACASSGGGEEVQVEEGVEGNQITEQEEVEGVKNEEVEGPKAPPPIGLTNFTFDIQFHPTIDLIACSDVSGRISLYPSPLLFFSPFLLACFPYFSSSSTFLCFCS